MKIFSTRIFLIIVLMLLAGSEIYVAGQTKYRQSAKKSKMVLISGATFEMGTDKADIPKLQELFKIKRAELFLEETPRRRFRWSVLCRQLAMRLKIWD